MKKNTSQTIKFSENTTTIITILVSGVIILGSGLLFYFTQDDVNKNVVSENDFMTPRKVEQTKAYKQAQPKSIVAIREDEILGSILVSADGMTLYTYAKDEEGASNCLDECLDNWPPLIASGDLIAGQGVNGTLAVIERADGIRQVTYNGAPLYFWKNDKVAGDATGGGIQNLWSVVNP